MFQAVSDAVVASTVKLPVAVVPSVKSASDKEYV